MTFLLKGILIGLVFGVPVGAVGALTIRRSIGYGTAAGLASGLGCSFADLLYACVSVFGLTLISDFMLRYENVFRCVGGILVILMGVGIMLKRQATVGETAKTSRLISFFTSSFIIAATNPATILTFILAFSIFKIGQVDAAIDGIGLITGIFLGTCIWWTMIALIVRVLGNKMTEKVVRRLNWVLGGCIVVFGSVVFVQVFL